MPAKKSKEATATAPERSFDLIKVVLSILLIAAVIGLLLLAQKYLKAKNDLTALQDPTAQQAKDKAEAQALVAKVGQLMVLPAGEPSIATVVDAAALASQQVFFQNAKNGDKVLIYKDKAILYDPAANQIVNVGPVLMANDQVATTTAPLSLEVRNGSQKIGAANDLSDRLKGLGYNVATVGNAANADYPQTLLINLTGKDVSALANQLKATATSQLPAGEAASSQDVLIILGNSKK
jgi:hypothetical protein